MTAAALQAGDLEYSRQKANRLAVRESHRVWHEILRQLTVHPGRRTAPRHFESGAGFGGKLYRRSCCQINGILRDIQTGESTTPNLQEKLEQTRQEFDRLLEMSLDFDEDTPFLDDRLKKLNNKIKSLKKAIEDSAVRQEKVHHPEMLLSAHDLQIQEYDDALTRGLLRGLR